MVAAHYPERSQIRTRTRSETRMTLASVGATVNARSRRKLVTAWYVQQLLRRREVPHLLLYLWIVSSFSVLAHKISAGALGSINERLQFRVL